MKDSRVAIFRKTLEGLIESLDATMRVARWTGAESIPDPLKESASHLLTRLGAADRLASGRFVGAPADTTKVNAMIGAMRRLDAAYVAYQRSDVSPRDRDLAAHALDAEIVDARSHFA